MIRHYVVTKKNKESLAVRLSGKIKDIISKNVIEQTCQKSGFNGYGYTIFENYYLVNDETYAIIEEILSNKTKKNKSDPITSWCKRLSKLAGITIEEAQIIAQKKIDYKTLEIERLEARQLSHISIKRDKLINKKYRENPLRRIEDEAHALAIVGANSRHCSTSYEDCLNYVHSLEEKGLIEKGDAKEKAHALLHGEKIF